MHPLDLGEARDLARIPPHLRDRLSMHLAGDDVGRSKEGLKALIARPECIQTLLAQLSGDALTLAAHLAFIRAGSRSRCFERFELLLGADATVRALSQLDKVGLLLESSFEPRQLSFSPTVAAALRPWLAPVLAHRGEVPHFDAAETGIAARELETRALLAALSGLGLRRAQSGEPYRREVSDLLQVLQHRFGEIDLLLEELDLLIALGLVTPGPRLDVDAAHVAQWQALDRGERLRHEAWQRGQQVPPLGPLLQLLHLAGPIPLLTLVELADLEASAESTLWRNGVGRKLDGAARVDLLLLLPGVGTVDVGSTRLVGLAPTLSAALAGDALPLPTGKAQLHILPTLELVVSPETPATDLLELGAFTELVAVDTVVRLKLSREAVNRAAARGLTPEAMLQRLQAASAHTLAETVTRAVRDFSRQEESRVEVIEAPVLLVKDPAVAQVLRTVPEVARFAREPSPGLFVLDAVGVDLRAALRKLRSLNLWIPVAEATEAPWPARELEAETPLVELRRLLQGRSVMGQAEPHARRARVAIALAALPPAPAGQPDRMEKARKLLNSTPEAWSAFLELQPEPQRQELTSAAREILDADRPLTEQLDRLDRLAPSWTDKVKKTARKRPSTRA